MPLFGFVMTPARCELFPFLITPDSVADGRYTRIAKGARTAIDKKLYVAYAYIVFWNATPRKELPCP